jgi:hypothetical protein
MARSFARPAAFCSFLLIYASDLESFFDSSIKSAIELTAQITAVVAALTAYTRTLITPILTMLF